MLKHKLVDFIIEFMEEVDKEISEMKLFVCNIRQPTDVLVGNFLTFLAERKSEIRGRIISNSSKCKKYIDRQANTHPVFTVRLVLCLPETGSDAYLIVPERSGPLDADRLRSTAITNTTTNATSLVLFFRCGANVFSQVLPSTPLDIPGLCLILAETLKNWAGNPPHARHGQS